MKMSLKTYLRLVMLHFRNARAWDGREAALEAALVILHLQHRPPVTLQRLKKWSDGHRIKISLQFRIHLSGHIPQSIILPSFPYLTRCPSRCSHNHITSVPFSSYIQSVIFSR